MRRALFMVLVAGGLAGCGADPHIGTTAAHVAACGGGLDYGTPWVGEAVTRAACVENGGTEAADLKLSVVSPDGFALDAAQPARVEGGARVLVHVTWHPRAPGPGAGTPVVRGSDGAELGFALSGSARAAPECDDGEPCTDDGFDHETGACVHTPRAGPCDDGSVCTANDTCVDGACVGTARSCDDGNACTQDLCDPIQGCVHPDDAARCDDGNPCTEDTCDAARGCASRMAPTGTLCGPGRTCITASACVAGVCTEVLAPDGTPCNDGRICTRGDVCAHGRCAGTWAPSEAALLGDAPAFGGPAVFEPDGTILFFTELTRGTRITRARRSGEVLVPEARWTLDGVQLRGATISALGVPPPMRYADGLFADLATAYEPDARATPPTRAVVFRLEAGGRVARSPLLPEEGACAGEPITSVGSIARAGSTLYVASLTGICVYDLADPTAPRAVRFIPDEACSQWSLGGVTRTGHVLWARGDRDTLCVFDVSRPDAPRTLETLPLWAAQILSSEDGTRAYVRTRRTAESPEGVRLFAVTGEVPQQVAVADDLGALDGMTLTPSALMVALYDDGFALLDRGDLRERARVPGAEVAAAHGDTVLTRGATLTWLDVSDPGAPAVRATVEPERPWCWNVLTDGATVVCADHYSTTGLALDRGPPARFVPLGHPALGTVGRLSRGPDGVWALGDGSARLLDLSIPEAPAFVLGGPRPRVADAYALGTGPGLPWGLPATWSSRTSLPARVRLASAMDPTAASVVDLPSEVEPPQVAQGAVFAGSHLVLSNPDLDRLVVIAVGEDGAIVEGDAPLPPLLGDGPALFADATGRWLATNAYWDLRHIGEAALWDLETPASPRLVGSREMASRSSAAAAAGRLAILELPWLYDPGRLRVFSPDGAGGLAPDATDVEIAGAHSILAYDGRMALVSTDEGLTFVDTTANAVLGTVPLPKLPRSVVEEGRNLVVSTETDVAVITPECPADLP